MQDHAVLCSRDLLSPNELGRALERVAQVFAQVQLMEQPMDQLARLRQTVTELPAADYFCGCLRAFELEGVFPPGSDPRATFIALLAADTAELHHEQARLWLRFKGTVGEAQRVQVALKRDGGQLDFFMSVRARPPLAPEVLARLHALIIEAARLPLELTGQPPTLRHLTSSQFRVEPRLPDYYHCPLEPEEPQLAVARLLAAVQKLEPKDVEASWQLDHQIDLRHPAAVDIAAAEALYAAIVRAKLPAASYRLSLALLPTIPHGIAAIGRFGGQGRKSTLLLVTASTRDNQVSFVVRALPAGCQLFAVGTHPLDVDGLSRDLGLALVPAKSLARPS